MNPSQSQEEKIAVSISPKGDVYSVNVLIPCDAEQTTCSAELQSSDNNENAPSLPVIMRNMPSGIALLMHVPKDKLASSSLVLHQIPALNRTLGTQHHYHIDLASQIFG